MANLHSYLHFDGNAAEAFNFYKSVFGGEFNTFARYKDTPPGVPMPEGTDGERVMHVSLPVGKNSILMGSDRPSDAFGKGARGDLSYIYVAAENREEATRIYHALSADGRVFMPLDDTFWGSYFGMLADKFGVQWMVAFESSQNAGA